MAIKRNGIINSATHRGKDSRSAPTGFGIAKKRKPESAIALSRKSINSSILFIHEGALDALGRKINLCPGTEKQHLDAAVFARNHLLETGELPSIKELGAVFPFLKVK